MVLAPRAATAAAARAMRCSLRVMVAVFLVRRGGFR
jgi:hypothetical protein